MKRRIAWGALPISVIFSIVFIGGCGSSTPQYEDGRDTVQSFGNGRFQVGEAPAKSYVIIDNKLGKVFAGGIVSWKQQGQFAYIIGAKPLRFYLINIPTEQLSLYSTLLKVPSPHQAIFKAMFSHPAKNQRRAA